jgi:hypothetical protein
MNEEKRPDLHPQDYALRLFGRKNLFPWLLVFACMIAGALLGALLSLALPPVYEARALVSTPGVGSGRKHHRIMLELNQ